MAIHQRMVMMILALMCQWACTQGLSFQNCNKEKVAELNLDDRNVNKTFTCVGISKNAVVRWKLRLPRVGRTIPAGVCQPFDGTVKSCDTRTSNLDGAVFPKRTSRSESTMTIHVQQLRNTLKNATLLCRVPRGTATRCPLDLIRPASGTCYAELDTESSPREWSVRVRCNITRGYSTRGRYRCLLSQESPGKREVADIRMTNTDRLPQGTAMCDHRFRVNTKDISHHRYSIQLTPGRTNITIDPTSQVVFDINSGNPVVAEKRSATFKCWATDGRPPPTLTLGGTGSGAELGIGQASLTYDWRDVHCEDSGTYTCTASNGMGPDKTVTSVFNVTCGPQGFSGQIPPFLYQGEEVQFTFDLVANPPPFKATFLFLGSTSEVKGIVLSGRCERKGETLVHATCTVTLSNLTSSGAAGLYRGSLTNGQGNLDFDFEVKLNGLVCCCCYTVSCFVPNPL